MTDDLGTRDELLLLNLLDLMMQMSDADISLLATAMLDRDAPISTTAESSNHVLWRELAKIGVLEEQRKPAIPLADTRIYHVNPDGIPRLQKLLSEFRYRRGHVRMTEIFETVCVPAGKQLVERVYDAGGDNAEVRFLLGLTLASVLHMCMQPKDYDSAVQQVTDLARKRLANAV